MRVRCCKRELGMKASSKKQGKGIENNPVDIAVLIFSSYENLLHYHPSVVMDPLILVMFTWPVRAIYTIIMKLYLVLWRILYTFI